MIPLSAYLSVSLFLFLTGLVGIIIRQSPVVMFMCIEMMLNAVNLSFVSFARYAPWVASGDITQTASQWMTGEITVLFVMAVAAAEVAVGLGMIMSIYKNEPDVNVDALSNLKG